MGVSYQDSPYQLDVYLPTGGGRKSCAGTGLASRTSFARAHDCRGLEAWAQGLRVLDRKVCRGYADLVVGEGAYHSDMASERRVGVNTTE